MSELRMNIDGRDVTAREGQSVLDAARAAAIEIPTLCHHELLEPHGGCRLCIVELDFGEWTQVVVSCVYPAKDGLKVHTRSEKIERLRKMIVELLMAHAPDSEPLKVLAAEYGAQRDRFEPEAAFCIHCGLCVRYCAEVRKKDAVGFIDRGVRKEIAFIPEIAADACPECKECFPLCPTSYVQAQWVLLENLTSGSGV